MKKFRFQLLAEWIGHHYNPCRVADIGGGKGLLSYLLTQKGFEAIVIDPEHQELPWKYKDIIADKRVKIPQGTTVPHITEPFTKDHARSFDLLVGLHAHGSNRWALEAAKEYGVDVLLLPCCVIDEPIDIQPNINWLTSLIDFGAELGLDLSLARLNFKGQSILMYTKQTKYAKTDVAFDPSLEQIITSEMIDAEGDQLKIGHHQER